MLGVFLTVSGGRRGRALPASCRPRGRPYEAYAASCVRRCRSRVWVAMLVVSETPLASTVLPASSGADAAAFHINVQRPMGGARDGQHVQAGLCRAAHHRPTPTMCDPLENQSTTARSAPATLSATRMPNVAARAAAAWRPYKFHSLHTGLTAQQPETRVVPRGGGMRGGQPRCARGNP